MESSEAIFYFALRPYNPEGLSLVHSLECADDAFRVDGNLALVLTPPIRCPAGLANGVAAYPLQIARGESRSFYTAMPLVLNRAGVLAAKPLRFARNYRAFKVEAQRLWQDKLAQGMRVKLPEARMQEAFEANVAYLLMFHDGNDITPGPYACQWRPRGLWWTAWAARPWEDDAPAPHCREVAVTLRGWSIHPSFLEKCTTQSTFQS